MLINATKWNITSMKWVSLILTAYKWQQSIRVIYFQPIGLVITFRLDDLLNSFHFFFFRLFFSLLLLFSSPFDDIIMYFMRLMCWLMRKICCMNRMINCLTMFTFLASIQSHLIMHFLPTFFFLFLFIFKYKQNISSCVSKVFSFYFNFQTSLLCLASRISCEIHYFVDFFFASNHFLLEMFCSTSDCTWE